MTYAITIYFIKNNRSIFFFLIYMTFKQCFTVQEKTFALVINIYIYTHQRLHHLRYSNVIEKLWFGPRHRSGMIV